MTVVLAVEMLVRMLDCYNMQDPKFEYCTGVVLEAKSCTIIQWYDVSAGYLTQQMATTVLTMETLTMETSA